MAAQCVPSATSLRASVPAPRIQLSAAGLPLPQAVTAYAARCFSNNTRSQTGTEGREGCHSNIGVTAIGASLSACELSTYATCVER